MEMVLLTAETATVDTVPLVAILRESGEPGGHRRAEVKLRGRSLEVKSRGPRGKGHKSGGRNALARGERGVE